MSCIGGLLHPLGPQDAQGMYGRLGGGNTSVMAPVGPGLIIKVDAKEYRLLSLEDEIEITGIVWNSIDDLKGIARGGHHRI